MIFGTFHNPKEFFETGFHDGASSRVGAMLAFRDVAHPPAAESGGPVEVRVA